MKIMISGTSGFLGGAVLERLSKEYAVKSVSIRDDNSEDVDSEVLRFKPDVFIHCGWKSGNSFKDTSNSSQFDNIDTGTSLLKTLSRFDNLHFVGFGSFAEYGIKSDITKETDIEEPNSYYGLSKKMFKDISRDYCVVNNFKWLWIRPCYIYGEGDVSSRLIPKVVNACKNNEDLVLDSCSSIVDYLHIDDFSEAIYELIKNKCSGVFNICSGQQYKIRDVVKQIQSTSSTSINIQFDSSKDRANSCTGFVCGSNEKLRTYTLWEPKINLSEGISKLV
jgi:nucleoside-diphosphate-sugar epimerase